MNTTKATEFLRTADAGAQFGVTRSALRHAVKTRKLRFYRLRRQIFLRLSDLHAWASARNREDQKRRAVPEDGSFAKGKIKWTTKNYHSIP